jgi:hypothetical protein
LDTNTPNRGEDLLNHEATSNTKAISAIQTGSQQNTNTSSLTNRANNYITLQVAFLQQPPVSN